MFSISFGEMAIILMVCLLVVGPKRLPSMARFCGHLIGRVNRQVSTVKREIRREMAAEDLRKAKEEAESAALEVRDAVGEGTRAIGRQVGASELGQAKKEAEALAAEVKDGAEAGAAVVGKPGVSAAAGRQD